VRWKDEHEWWVSNYPEEGGYGLFEGSMPKFGCKEG
jgi:hypothetical protein